MAARFVIGLCIVLGLAACSNSDPEIAAAAAEEACSQVEVALRVEGQDAAFAALQALEATHLTVEEDVDLADFMVATRKACPETMGELHHRIS